MDAIGNILTLAALAGAGGIVFVGVCMAVIRAFDILEGDHD